MYHVIVRKVYRILFSNSNIKNTHLCGLCIEYLLPLVLNSIIASGIGYTFEVETEMVIFSVFYTILKTSNGGNYYKLNLKNAIFVWSSAVVAIKAIPYSLAFPYQKSILVIVLVSSLIITFAFFPILIQKMGFSKEMQKMFLHMSYTVITIECVPLIVGVALSSNQLITAAIVGVLLQNISLFWTQKKDQQLILLCEDSMERSVLNE